MNVAYPIVLKPSKRGYLVYISDFDINTQGKNVADAMLMARDAIGLMGIDMEDDGEPVPVPTAFDEIVVQEEEMKLMVDVDFRKYRREHDTRAVRKNCTIPSWLNEAACKAGINFSAVLQEALKKQLGLE